MKYLGLGISVVCALAAGYLIGLSQNTSDIKSTATTKETTSLVEPKGSNVSHLPQNDTSKPNTVKVSNTPEGEISSTNGEEIQPAPPSQFDDLNNSALPAKRKSDEYPVAQQELDDWIATYKPRLKQDMINTLGEDSAEFMFEQINKENPFLNQPTANNHLEDDLSTRHDLEQAIRDYIELATIDPETELLNAKCIQGRCEVTIAGMAQNAAIFIYMEISGNAIPALDELKTPTLYVDPKKPEQGYWAYMLFQY